MFQGLSSYMLTVATRVDLTEVKHQFVQVNYIWRLGQRAQEV